MDDVVLPQGWAWARLGDLGTECRTHVHPEPDTQYELWSVPSYATGQPELVQGSEIGSTKLATYPNDVLICKINPRINRVWMTTLGAQGRVKVASPEWLVFQPIASVQDFLAPYLRHYLSSPQFRDWITGAVSGATGSHARAKANQILDQVVPVPPLAEQRRIVETVEDHLSRLTVATNAVADARRRIKPFNSSVLNRVVLGISSARCFDDDAVNGSRRLLAGHSSKRFDHATLPSLPKGWLWRRASDICEFISSGSTPKAHLMHAEIGDIPFLKVYNITQDGRIDFTNKPTYVDRETHENQLKRSRVRPGDVLTNIVGPPLGKTAVVPGYYPEWNINQAIVAFRAARDVHPEWLALVLRTPFILGMLQKTAKATAGQFNVALSTCRELPLPVPPMGEQLRLVSESAELLEVGDRFAAQVIPIAVRSQKLRQAVLRRAFSGQLVHQDPVDEPASVLIDRIRAERAVRIGQNSAKRPTRRPLNATDTADLAPLALPPTSSPLPINAVQQEFPL